MNNDRLLNDLIGSRICHDLISPLGAIGNGVELLSMSGAGAAPEMALISESIENANARIRYFRVAFGAASHSALIGNQEIRSILRDVYRGSRVKADWRAEQDLPRDEVKLAFLLILCLESALPWGGTIRVTRTNIGHWTLTAMGERQKIDANLWDLVSNPNSQTEVTPSEVQFALVAPIANRMNRKVITVSDPQRITVNF
jgi:histidine phosphotransferase ChpT